MFDFLRVCCCAETKFDDRLGPHVRRYAYCYLLFVPSTFKLLTQGASRMEKVVVWFMMPLLRRLLYKELGCSKPGSKERSLQEIESIFKEVSRISLAPSIDINKTLT